MNRNTIYKVLSGQHHNYEATIADRLAGCVSIVNLILCVQGPSKCMFRVTRDYLFEIPRDFTEALDVYKDTRDTSPPPPPLSLSKKGTHDLPLSIHS